MMYNTYRGWKRAKYPRKFLGLWFARLYRKRYYLRGICSKNIFKTVYTPHKEPENVLNSWYPPFPMKQDSKNFFSISQNQMDAQICKTFPTLNIFQRFWHKVWHQLQVSSKTGLSNWALWNEVLLPMITTLISQKCICCCLISIF